MSEDKSVISAAAGTDDLAKPWRLPFWTDDPDYSLQRDNHSLVIARKDAQEQLQSRQRRRQPDQPQEPVVASSDNDDECLILPTAEELENIRREAWNAGLEQGLVEGRQQGHKAGYDEGFAAGRKDGHNKGLNEGKGEGLKQGRDEGLAKGQNEIDEQVRQLQALQNIVRKQLLQRDSELPDILASLIRQSCEQVLGYELENGARRIFDYLQATLTQLPEAEQEKVQIFISPADAACLEHSLLNNGTELHYRTDSQLRSGECRIQSPNSRAEFSLEEHLQQLLQQTLPLLSQAAPSAAQSGATLQADLHQELEFMASQPESMEEPAQNAASADTVVADQQVVMDTGGDGGDIAVDIESDRADDNHPDPGVLAAESDSPIISEPETAGDNTTQDTATDNTTTDNTETDNTETDNTETDNTETDNTETKDDPLNGLPAEEDADVI
jgi:flagellar assembly protein FliH